MKPAADRTMPQKNRNTKDDDCPWWNDECREAEHRPWWDDECREAETKPQEKRNTKDDDCPWWNDECREAIQMRKRMLNRLRRNRSDANLMAYKQAKARQRYIIRKAKKESCERLLRNDNARRKKLWDILQRFTMKEKIHKPFVILNIDGNIIIIIIIDDPQEHTDPDYSATLVVLQTNTQLEGYGTTFTIGRGNEIVCECVKALKFLVVGKTLRSIVDNFATFWDNLVNESQLRWIGPQKGVIHLATAALVNAIWDLWARSENKPVWRLLVDMTPDQLVNVMDFRYITDVLTKEEAVDMLTIDPDVKEERVKKMVAEGYPAYTTAAGWLGYPDEKIRSLCLRFMEEGWDEFKIKVGQDLADDRRRLRVVRDTIGPDRPLMVDANQRWDVNEAIYWMKELSEFRPLWIEEPTSPDDVLGHAQISKALAPYGIGVATGEMCQNKVMFKQFLQAGGMQFCQVDSCRVGSINEILPIYLMAKKFNVPVCPHAGGICLNEMVQHLQLFDYVRVTGSTENRRVEYVCHLSEHLETPAVCRRSRYMPPEDAGYSCKFKPAAICAYSFPDGSEWKRLIARGMARNTRDD